MKISVHLSFNGQCGEAFADYARIFNGTIVFQMKYRDSPMATQVGDDWQDKLYHATLTMGGITLLGGDLAATDLAPGGFALVVNPDGLDEANGIFSELSQDGLVKMPIQETFWSPAFGVVVDRYGVEWSINCEAVPEVS